MKWAEDPKGVGLFHRRFDLRPLDGFAAAILLRAGLKKKLSDFS
jgi:hypothetical protein